MGKTFKDDGWKRGGGKWSTLKRKAARGAKKAKLEEKPEGMKRFK